MTEIGNVALWVALALGVWGAGAAFVGGHLRRGDLVLSAERAVYAVFGSDEEARRIGRAMIERRLAACINILWPCHSIYRWQGAIEEADEVAAIFKTRAEAVEALIAAIRAAHSYETAAIVAFPIGSSDPNGTNPLPAASDTPVPANAPRVTSSASWR